MQLKATAIFASILIVPLTARITSAQTLENKSQTTAEQNQEAPATSESVKQETPVENLERLQALSAEVEARLESLVTLLGEQEHSMTSREQKLIQMESRLATKAAEIASAEQALRTQKVISWVALAIGLGALVLSFVMQRGRLQGENDQPAPVTTVKTPIDADTKVVENDTSESSLKSSETEKKAGRKTTSKTKLATSTLATERDSQSKNGSNDD